ncbi:MAG: TGS domain-containing protein [Longimicrobiales bacterium]|nr:TGS domain-containing protein [Longimicrobiales bacterium]
MAAWDRGDYTEALEVFDEVVRGYPRFPDVHNKRGLCLALLGRPREAEVAFLRMDLFHGEIFVVAADGDVKALPTGATPIDFAYSVHTEVGQHCAGAKVNGRIAPLSPELKNGDTSGGLGGHLFAKPVAGGDG